MTVIYEPTEDFLRPSDTPEESRNPDPNLERRRRIVNILLGIGFVIVVLALASLALMFLIMIGLDVKKGIDCNKPGASLSPKCNHGGTSNSKHT